MSGSTLAVRGGGAPTSGEVAFTASKRIESSSLPEWRLVVCGPSSCLSARKNKKGSGRNLVTDLPPRVGEVGSISGSNVAECGHRSLLDTWSHVAGETEWSRSHPSSLRRGD
jgi:hypothetical protein